MSLNRDNIFVGMVLVSPITGEIYEITALGKRYLLVEVKTKNSAHEFPRRYEEIANYQQYQVSGEIHE